MVEEGSLRDYPFASRMAVRNTKDELAGGGGGGLDGAVATFTFLVIEEGFEEARAVEIGPQRLSDENFSVRDLPQQEIADAHFAAGADEKIGIGKVGGVEVACQIFLGDRLGRLMAVARGEDCVHGIDNFCTATIVQRDVQDHTGVFRQRFSGFASIFLDGFGEFVSAPQKTHADIVSLEQRHLFANVFAQELHQEFDLGFGAAPILDGKGVESERFDLQTRGGLDGNTGRFCSGAVSGNARKMTLLSPAAVAVHDDGDVAREAGEIEFLEEARFFGGDGSEGFELNAGMRHGVFPKQILFTAQS